MWTNECLIFITWNIIKIQIDVLVEFRRNIHSVYIFNLPMLINNRYHWKHMALRRDSCIELIAFDTTPPSLLILILFSLKKCWNSRKTCKNTHTRALTPSINSYNQNVTIKVTLTIVRPMAICERTWMSECVCVRAIFYCKNNILAKRFSIKIARIGSTCSARKPWIRWHKDVRERSR